MLIISFIVKDIFTFTGTFDSLTISYLKRKLYKKKILQSIILHFCCMRGIGAIT